MKLKAGHLLLIALIIIFNGCDMFEGVFKSSSTITLENNTNKEIANVEILLGREVKKIDTTVHAPFQAQKYEVASKSVYTVCITFADGSQNFRWADVTDSEDITIAVDVPISSEAVALSLNSH